MDRSRSPASNPVSVKIDNIMSTARSAMQVGILVVVAGVLFVGGYLFLEHDLLLQNTYTLSATFADAQGIRAGSDVEYSGVLIGHVEDVSLDQTTGAAILKMRVNKRIGDRYFKIPTDAVLTISSSLLGGESTLNIAAPHHAAGQNVAYWRQGSTIPGSTGASLASLQNQAGSVFDQVKITAQKANHLIDEASITAAAMNKIIADPKLRESLQDTVHNINMASAQGLQLTKQLRTSLTSDNAQVQDMLLQDNGMAQKSLRDLNHSTAAMARLTDGNQGKIQTIVDNLNETTATIDRMAVAANKVVTHDGTVQNMSDTVSSLKSAADKLNGIEDDLSKISHDPKVQADLKTTLSNTAAASGHISSLIDTVDKVLGPHASGGRKLVQKSRLTFIQSDSPHQFRTDVNLYASLGGQDFMRAGLNDVTGANQLNLQYGLFSTYNRRVSYRVGVYRSKVGLGADYDVFGDRTLSFDLYDPNFLKFDVRQRIPITPQVGILIGAEDIPRNDTFIVGLDLQR